MKTYTRPKNPSAWQPGKHDALIMLMIITTDWSSMLPVEQPKLKRPPGKEIDSPPAMSLPKHKPETPVEIGSDVETIVVDMLQGNPISANWLRIMPASDRDDLLQDVKLSCLVAWRKQLLAGDVPKLSPVFVFMTARRILANRETVIQSGIAVDSGESARALSLASLDLARQQQLVREHAVYAASLVTRPVQVF